MTQIALPFFGNPSKVVSDLLYAVRHQSDADVNPHPATWQE